MKTRLDAMNLGEGALQDLFDNSMKKVMANINDPSTKSTAVRKISLEIAITPDESRSMASFVISASTTLAHIKPVSTAALLEQQDGKLTAYIHQSEEAEEELPGNIISMEKRA